MPQIEIRPAISTDIPALMSLEHYYLTGHVWQMERSSGDDVVGVAFREMRLPRSVRTEYPRSPQWLLDGWKNVPGLIVALFGGEPVGYITLTEQLSANTAWIRDLVVAENMRRKGIASALVLAGQEWSLHRGYRRMILEMQSKNYPSIRLALRLGYEFCGFHDQYYANQDIALFFARYLR